ncbi:putative transposase, partial [Neisseria meningitidis 98002]
MSTFFRQTAQAMIAKHIDRFPLLKLDQVIDWQPIEQYLNRPSMPKRLDSAENRQHLKNISSDGIMRKACRNRPLSETQ